MFDFFKILWSLLSTAFSGFGNIICEKLFKKKPKKRNSKSQSLSTDKETILYAIDKHGSSKQREIFMRYFYKYKNYFSADDVKNLTQKSDEDHPNYSILLNILLGLIESINQN